LSWPADDFLIALRDASRLRGEASNAVETPSTHRAQRPPSLPKRRPVCLTVHRHENLVYYKRLQKVQFALLEKIQSGATLEHALQTLPPSAAPHLQKWFETWSTLGWFYLK